MQVYAFFIALANFGLVGLTIAWYSVDKGNFGSQVIAASLAFNMAMGWLLIAGYRKRAEGHRWWSPTPVVAALVLCGILFLSLLRAGRP